MIMQKRKKNKNKNKVNDPENEIDDVNQYERRDTIIVNGSSLPKEIPNENPTDVLINAVKDNLRNIIIQSDINVAHRLGTTLNTTQANLSMLNYIVVKKGVINVCITIRPNLHIIESLTRKRLALFKTI